MVREAQGEAKAAAAGGEEGGGEEEEEGGGGESDVHRSHWGRNKGLEEEFKERSAL